MPAPARIDVATTTGNRQLRIIDLLRRTISTSSRLSFVRSNEGGICCGASTTREQQDETKVDGAFVHASASIVPWREQRRNGSRWAVQLSQRRAGPLVVRKSQQLATGVRRRDRAASTASINQSHVEAFARTRTGDGLDPQGFIGTVRRRQRPYQGQALEIRCVESECVRVSHAGR